jgi:hypothetical protein
VSLLLIVFASASWQSFRVLLLVPDSKQHLPLSRVLLPRRWSLGLFLLAPLLEISAGEVHLMGTELLEGEQLVTVVAFTSLSSLDNKKCCLR